MSIVLADNQRRFRRGAGAVAALKELGGPWGYFDPEITDDRFPSRGEGGIIQVSYRIFKVRAHQDGPVRSDSVAREFGENRVRRCYPDEALAFFSDQQVGRGGLTLVALLQDMNLAFVIDEDEQGRHLTIRPDFGHWHPVHKFLCVSEDT